MFKQLYLTAAAVIVLAGCDSSGGATPGPQELALATGALDQQLNLPADVMRRTLASANADKRIFPAELVVTDASGTMAVDWWLYDHGFIRVGGVQDYQGYFVLTDKGEALVKGGPPHWIVSSFQGQPQVTCAGSEMFASCRVVAIAAVGAAANAKDLVADPSSVPVQNFQVVLQKTQDGWSAGEFADSSTPPPADAGRRALFGDPRLMGPARARFAQEVNKQVH
jgi:hypothetical protein